MEQKIIKLMTIFDYLKNICEKDKYLNVEYDKEFQPYILIRYFSFMHKNIAYILNESLNGNHLVYNKNQLVYNTLYSLIPKTNYNYNLFNYIKSNNPKKKQSNNQDKIENIANLLEISQREVKVYIENDEFSKSIKDMGKTYKK